MPSIREQRVELGHQDGLGGKFHLIKGFAKHRTERQSNSPLRDWGLDLIFMPSSGHGELRLRGHAYGGFRSETVVADPGECYFLLVLDALRGPMKVALKLIEVAGFRANCVDECHA